jgi:hypothetical protein
MPSPSEAARKYPMLAVKPRPDFSVEGIRDLIREGLTKGMSTEKTRQHATQELLRSAMAGRQAQPGPSPALLSKDNSCSVKAGSPHSQMR